MQVSRWNLLALRLYLAFFGIIGYTDIAINNRTRQHVPLFPVRDRSRTAPTLPANRLQNVTSLLCNTGEMKHVYLLFDDYADHAGGAVGALCAGARQQQDREKTEDCLLSELPVHRAGGGRGMGGRSAQRKRIDSAVPAAGGQMRRFYPDAYDGRRAGQISEIISGISRCRSRRTWPGCRRRRSRDRSRRSAWPASRC